MKYTVPRVVGVLRIAGLPARAVSKTQIDVGRGISVKVLSPDILSVDAGPARCEMHAVLRDIARARNSRS